MNTAKFRKQIIFLSAGDCAAAAVALHFRRYEQRIRKTGKST